MERNLVSVLEENTTKVKGVAVILDIMAASPGNVSELIDSGDTYALLGNMLHEVYEDLYEQLVEELQNQSNSFENTGL